MPKALGVLLESELHGGELNQGMDCDLMGMRVPGREDERSSPHCHTDYILGASSHLSLLWERQVPWTLLGEIACPEPLRRAAWTEMPQVWLLLPSVSCTLYPWAGNMVSSGDSSPGRTKCNPHFSDVLD